MFNKTKSSLAITLSVAMLATMVTIPGVASAATAAKQLSGADRYATALKIVEDGWKTSTSAVIARGDDLADALAAAPLAYAKGKAPILLTKTNEIPAGVLAELKALGVKNVYIVGGVGAVSKAVADDLAAAGLTITRVSGNDRFETSLKIAKEAFGTAPAEVVIANGLAYADALSVSSIAAAKGMPILLVNNSKLSADQAAYIAGKTVYAVGGEGVLNTDIVSVAKAERISGLDRYKTNAAVLAKFKPDYSKIYLAKGTPANLVDALAGSALAALTNSPIVLVDQANKINVEQSAVVKANVTGNSAVVTLGGTVTQAAADAIDALKSQEVALKSVTAIGAKKINVTFNTAVDTTKATITVKKGTVAVNTDAIDFSADKMSATITTTTNLTKGDYTVTVAGLSVTALTSTITVTDVKVAKVNVVSQTAPMLSGTNKKALVKYEVLNQYGEKMVGEPISWTVSTGMSITNEQKTTGNGSFEITAAGTLDFIPGASVYVTGVHVASGTVVNAEVKIGLASKADSVAFKGVYNTVTNKIEALPAGFVNDKYVLLFEVSDQYGNVMANPDHTDLVFTSNNPLFVSNAYVDGTDVTIDEVDYEAIKLVQGTTVDKGGIVTVQAISKITGKVSTYNITAVAVSAVKTFTISAPSTIVSEGAKTEIPFAALDQFGNAITKYSVLTTGTPIQLSSGSAGTSVFAFEQQDDGTAKLFFTPDANSGATDDIDALAYLSSVVKDGGSYSSTMVSVKETARPSAIVGLDALKSTSVAAGNKVEIKGQDLIVQDQYGRVMTDAKVNAWLGTTALPTDNKIVVTSDILTNTPVTVTTGGGIDMAMNAINMDTDIITVTAKAATVTGLNATEKLVFSLSTATTATPIASSSKSLTFTKVNQDAYVSYEVADLGTMYNNTSTTTPAIDVTDTKFDKTLKVYGVKADGTKVLLPAADYSVTTDGKLIGSTNVISDQTTGGYVAADFLNSSNVYEAVSVNVLVTVKDLNGAAASVIEKLLLVSNKAAKVQTIAVDEELVTAGKATIVAGAISNTVINKVIDKTELRDQYGVVITETPIVTVTNLVKVDASTLAVLSNGTTTASITGAKMGDKFTVTYKYASGVKLVIEYTVGL